MYRDARATYARAGRLFEVHLDLLYQCDLDCTHCYLDDKARRVLPTSFWMDVIEQLGDMGVFSVTLSGGEVLLRKDLLELVSAARRRGLFVHVKSHGGGITDAVARRLAELAVSSVQVSYYAADPAIHDAITRRPGSHAATLAGLKALRRHGVLTLVACSVLDANRDAVAGVVDQLAELGIPVKIDPNVRAANSGAAFPLDTGLGHDALVAVNRQFGLAADPCALDADPAADDRWGTEKLCVAGHLSLYVDPEGRVTPCVTWPEPLGDLAAGDRLDAIWRSSARLGEIRGYRKGDRETCGGCGLREACDFCPGQAYIASRKPLAPADPLCRSSFARARAADGNAPPPPPSTGGLFRIRSAQASDHIGDG